MYFNVLFADAQKCFERLWLEDCLVDKVKGQFEEKGSQVVAKFKQEVKNHSNNPMWGTKALQ